MCPFRFTLLPTVAICIALIASNRSTAELIPVRHMEGVTHGFLVLRSPDGRILAYGDWTQVASGKTEQGLVVDNLRFEFQDGSFYEEITKFTQNGKFRLVSDQVEERGPAFKQPSKSWIDARTGMVTVRTLENGKEKMSSTHVNLPEDIANGLLLIILKNVDPSVGETTISYVAASTKPRVVKWNIHPATEGTVKIGTLRHKTQHYVVKTKIEGMAGVVAPLLGKQPPDIDVWLVKSEAPTFIEYQGPLTPDTPVWRIELAAPEPDTTGAK